MLSCDAFQRVHPEGGTTNPDGVYPNGVNPQKEGGGEKEEEVVVVEEKDVESMTTRELKRVVTDAGLGFGDCIEKEDLRVRAREALGR